MKKDKAEWLIVIHFLCSGDNSGIRIKFKENLFFNI